jgi:hypothetical protein
MFVCLFVGRGSSQLLGVLDLDSRVLERACGLDCASSFVATTTMCMVVCVVLEALCS